MNLGRLDRAATLYRNVPAVGTGGTVTDSLTKVCDLQVSYETPSSKTIIAGARDAEQTETVFQSRWFDGLVTGMFLRTEGQLYRITRRDQLGRREGWRIYGREVV